MTAREKYPLRFGGEIIAQPSEITDLKIEKIWSGEAGRAADGNASGRLKCVKRTFTIKWFHLTPAEVKQINKYINSVRSAFFSVSMLNEEFEYETFMVYAATPTYDIWGWDENRQFCKGLQVELIQQ